MGHIRHIRILGAVMQKPTPLLGTRYCEDDPDLAKFMEIGFDKVDHKGSRAAKSDEEINSSSICVGRV